MKYYLNQSNELVVEIMTMDEYKQNYPKSNDASQLFDVGVHIKHTKVHLMADYIYGTLFLPKLKESGEHGCYFYLDNQRLTIVEDDAWLNEILKDILHQSDEDELENPSQVLSLILEWMVYSQEDYLDQVEYALKLQEAELLNENNKSTKDLDHEFHIYGRELMAVKRYYQQLTDICDLLEDNLRERITRDERRKLQYLTQHAARLANDAKDLREYVMQLREIFMADISNKQNRIMQILTVVTTIFMPLTLLTGWYGMNFNHMPELSHPLGYPIVIIFAISVIIFEVILIIKKKWLD